MYSLNNSFSRLKSVIFKYYYYKDQHDHKLNFIQTNPVANLSSIVEKI